MLLDINENLENYTKKELEKIEAMLYLIVKKSESRIFLTRLIKLLYLIDETSVLEIGIPATPLKYKVAKKGPLPVSLWKGLAKNETKEFIKVSWDEEIKGWNIQPLKEPNLKLLSEYERELIYKIVEKYKDDSTLSVIDHIHEKQDSLWKKIVEQERITFNSNNITDYVIDFTDLVKDDNLKKYFLQTFYSTRSI